MAGSAEAGPKRSLLASFVVPGSDPPLCVHGVGAARHMKFGRPPLSLFSFAQVACGGGAGRGAVSAYRSLVGAGLALFFREGRPVVPSHAAIVAARRHLDPCVFSFAQIGCDPLGVGAGLARRFAQVLRAFMAVVSRRRLGSYSTFFSSFFRRRRSWLGAGLARAAVIASRTSSLSLRGSRHCCFVHAVTGALQVHTGVPSTRVKALSFPSLPPFFFCAWVVPPPHF
ncbi:hypothetical protein C8J57DRAFT_1707228, partial [Mycena rebaudengoi]